MSRNRPKLQTLKSPLQVLKTPLEAKLKPLRAPRKTLKERQAETGRTLALNGAKWRRLRAAVLRENPLCLYCAREDRLTAASQVDHADNNPANNEWSNLIACCESCHSRKTQADMGHRVRYGCDASGMPADPDHPWNRER